MTLPAGVTTCLVFKKAPVSFGGTGGGVEVHITPSVRLVHTATGTPLADFIEEITPAESSVAQVSLPHTDQAGFQDEAGNAFINWHYTARVRLTKTGSQTKTLPLFSFQIPAGQVEIDLSKVPHGVASLATSAPIAVVTSINGVTGASDTYRDLARTPEAIMTGTITRDANGAITSAAVMWPSGPGTFTAGTFTGTPSGTFPGSLDSYTITRGTVTYTQPAVTRDASGNITNQPAIVLS